MTARSSRARARTLAVRLRAPIRFPPPDAAVLHLVRENLRLLADLTARYEAGRLDAPRHPPAGSPAALAFRSPRQVADYLAPEMAGLPQEQLRALLLTTKHTLLGCVLVAQGTIDGAPCRLADAFREAVRANAAAVLFAHNHPSGDPAPSPQDVSFTADAGRAGALLGIRVLDHVVIGGGPVVGPIRFASLRELGLYTPDGADDAPGASGGHRSPCGPDHTPAIGPQGATDGV
jgi:DNA repair protein RadC